MSAAAIQITAAAVTALADAELCSTCLYLQLEEHLHPCSDCAHLHPRVRGLRSLYAPRTTGTGTAEARGLREDASPARERTRRVAS